MLENINIVELATSVGGFVAIGVMANIARYRNKVGDNPEKWRATKAAPLILIGVVAGLLAYALGLPADMTVMLGLIGGLVPITDELRTASATFYETYQAARGRGVSQTDAAVEAGTDAAFGVDQERVRDGVAEIQDQADRHATNDVRNPPESTGGDGDDVVTDSG